MYTEYIELIWFFTGVFVYRFVTTIFAYSHMTLLVRDVYGQILKLLGFMAEDIAFIRAVKYEHMLEAGLTEEQVESIRKIDTRAFFVWKTNCVSRMLTNCPKDFRNQLKFSDWKSAMSELDQLYKKEVNK